MQVASEEGVRVTDHLSMLTDFTTGGLYDDSTIYMLDRQIFGITNNALLPPPRSEQESLWTTAYRYHFDNNFPMLSGFFQIRNANGEESLPQEALIINRNTFDYNFNSALNPVLHHRQWLDCVQHRLAVHHSARHRSRRQYDEPESVPPVRVFQQQFLLQLDRRSMAASITKRDPSRPPPTSRIPTMSAQRFNSPLAGRGPRPRSSPATRAAI